MVVESPKSPPILESGENKMSKEVTKKESSEAVIYDESMMGAWGGDNEFDQSDIIIPKIMLMQGGSQLVNSEVARPGEYLHSVTKAILGSAKNPVIFTPIHMTKKWRITKKTGNDYKFSHYEDVNKSNIDAPKEFKIGNIEAQRQLCYNFYVLVENQPVPFILQLKGISHGAGKQLSNEMYVTNPVLKLPPSGRAFKLLVEDVPFDGKIYKGYKIEFAKNNDVSYVMGNCLDWYKIINSGAIKTDSVEEEETSSKSSTVHGDIAY